MHGRCVVPARTRRRLSRVHNSSEVCPMVAERAARGGRSRGIAMLTGFMSTSLVGITAFRSQLACTHPVNENATNIPFAQACALTRFRGGTELQQTLQALVLIECHA